MQRLRFFVQIARAVAYAHGKLMVHRASETIECAGNATARRSDHADAFTDNIERQPLPIVIAAFAFVASSASPGESGRTCV
jgi:hypothetical protein